MFTDKVEIFVRSGAGGDGCISFRREKYIANGGPDGGDGGDGGNIIFEAESGMNSLIDFRYKKKFFADKGENGGKKNCSGAKADDLVIKVPVGTLIRERNTNKIMADMAYAGQKKIIAKGGKGGNGNQHYATSRRQAPKYAERGGEPQEFNLILELKLIADVGLVGLPNAGKSSLLSMVTNAKPKIAGYQFTTLSPNLGVVRTKYKTFVMADIPGLIEGASSGLGLGHQFLRHVERTKILLHVIDIAISHEDPITNIEKINKELRLYNEKLMNKKQIIVANKIDLPDTRNNIERVKKYCADNSLDLFMVSAATNEGLSDLINFVAQMVDNDVSVFEEDYVEPEDVLQDRFVVKKVSEGIFEVGGKAIEKMLGYTNLDVEAGFNFFQKYMYDNGIIDMLKEKGLKDGDVIRILDLEFDYVE